MDISDLLAMLTGGGGGDQGAGPVAAPGDAPSIQAAPTGGVGGFLGDTDPGAPDQATQTPVPPPVVAPAAAAPAPPPGPSTPPSDQTDGGGIGGFLSRMIQKANARDPDTGTSFVDRLGKFGAQITDMTGETSGAARPYDTAATARVAATQAETKSQKLTAMAKQLGLQGREALVFAANPDEWVKANAGNLKNLIVPGGDSVLSPGAPPYTAPKIGQQNGEGFSATTTGITDLGGIQPSPQQQAQDDVKRAQQAAIDTYHQTMAKAATTRAAADATRANKPALGNGGDWRGRIIGQGSVQ